MDANSKNRFIGSKSYEEEDNEIFYGRKQEARELIQLININSFTLFYGRSGLGKTSLLKAGVFPELYRKNYLPIYFRFNFTDETKDYIKLIEDILIGKNKTEIDDKLFQVQNIESNETLWEYFHHKPITNSKTGIAVTPLLVFDQFEEIFTLGTKEKSGEFRDNVKLLVEFLSDLIENSPPDNLPEEKRMKLRYEHASAPVPVKVIFSFKEEYLSSFYSLSSHIPSMAYSNLQYRLLPLNYEKGYSIIHEVSQELFEEEAIEETLRVITESGTIDEAKQRDVDSFLLSVFCASRVEELAEGKKISKEDVAKVDIQKLINSLYKNIVDELQLNKEEKLFIEDKLITPEGYRLPVYLSVAESIPNLRIAKIKELEQKNVLRRFIIDGNPCIEIIHDKYAAAVKSDRDFRLNAERENLNLIKAQEELKRKTKETNDLLEKQRIELELKRASEEKRISEVEADLALEKLKRERKIRRIMVIALFFSIAMAIITLISFNQSQINLKKANTANSELHEAGKTTNDQNKQLRLQMDIVSNNNKQIRSMIVELRELNKLANEKKQLAIANADQASKQELKAKIIADRLQIEKDKAEKILTDLKATKDTLSNQRQLGYLIPKVKKLQVKNPAIAYLLIKSAKKIDPQNKEAEALFDSLSNQTGYFESRLMKGKQSVFIPDGRILTYDNNNSINIGDLNGNKNILFPESKNFSNAIISDDGKQVLAVSPSNISLWTLESDRVQLKLTKPVKNVSHFSFLNDNQGFIVFEKDTITIRNSDGGLISNFKSPDDFLSIKAVAKDSSNLLCVDWEKGITIINLNSFRSSGSNYLNNEQEVAFLIPNKNHFITIDKSAVHVRDFKNKVLSEFPIYGSKADNYNNVIITSSVNGTKAIMKYNNIIYSTIPQKQMLFPFRQKNPVDERSNLKVEVKYYMLDFNNGNTYRIPDFLVTDKLAYNGVFNSGFFSDNGNYFMGNFKDIDFGNTMYIWDVSKRDWKLDGKITVYDESLTGGHFLKTGNDKFALTSAPKNFLVNKEINTILWIYGKAKDLDEKGKLPKLSDEELYSIAGITINEEKQFKY